MRFPAKGWSALTSDERGVSAIEFALLAPALILLLLAGSQIALYINAMRRVQMIAASISEMLSQAAPPSGSTTASVNQLDVHFAYDAALVLFPYVMKDAARQGIPWWQDITINFASIKFQGNGLLCGNNPDQSACYVAQVAWTSTGTSGGKFRPCGPSQTPTDNTAVPSPTALPRSLYGSGSIIAVDVSFKFTPTFGASFLPALTINRSVFVQPRYAKYITFDTTNNDGIATLCPGSS